MTIYGVPLRVSPPEGWLPKEGEKESDDIRLDFRSSLDNELALVLADEYPLGGWIDNSYFIGNGQMKLPIARGDVLMVSRLDGPDERVVKES
ncbi:MAG: hypothetical protein IME96_07900 [Proteobacteria bacterium]|nr:hypothetical protein [Pseudomonadota bacterium]